MTEQPKGRQRAQMDGLLSIEGRLPPQAPELEQAVLGAIMLNDDRGMAEVGDILRPEMFYVHAHQLIYGAMVRLYEKGQDIDILTVTMDLKASGELDTVGGPFYVSQLTNKVAQSLHIQTHALIVVQQYIAREAIRLNTEAANKAYAGDDAFDVVESTIHDLEQSIAHNLKRRAVSYHDAEVGELERMNSPARPLQRSGFDALDRIIGGYPRGALTIVAGRPGMGKTSYAVSSVMESAEAGRPVGLFSLELNAEKMQARAFGRTSGVPISVILQGAMTPEQIAKRNTLLTAAKSLPLFIRYDSGISVEDIKAEATRMVRNHGVECIFIDQLNWIKPPKGQNRDVEVGNITRALKHIATQLDIAIVLLHQLSRAVEARPNKRPQISDLRDSGNVEQDAEIVMFLLRPEHYGILEDDKGNTIDCIDVIVAKNSNGACDDVRLHFRKHTASVHNPVDAYRFDGPNPNAPHPDSFTEPDAF